MPLCHPVARPAMEIKQEAEIPPRALAHWVTVGPSAQVPLSKTVTTPDKLEEEVPPAFLSG